MSQHKPTKARVAKLQAALEAVRAQVYACGPDRNTPFSTCLDLATPGLRERHDDAHDALNEAEREAVATGRAYRAMGGFGLLLWHK
jgi:alkylation response protein AidB-like acyl-CoA dehydrogenase